MLGYTMSDEPIRAREKCYPPVWLILKAIIHRDLRGVIVLAYTNSLTRQHKTTHPRKLNFCKISSSVTTTKRGFTPTIV